MIRPSAPLPPSLSSPPELKPPPPPALLPEAFPPAILIDGAVKLPLAVKLEPTMAICLFRTVSSSLKVLDFRKPMLLHDEETKLSPIETKGASISACQKGSMNSRSNKYLMIRRLIYMVATDMGRKKTKV